MQAWTLDVGVVAEQVELAKTNSCQKERTWSSANRSSRHDLPTPESPISTSLNKWSLDVGQGYEIVRQDVVALRLQKKTLYGRAKTPCVSPIAMLFSLIHLLVPFA